MKKQCLNCEKEYEAVRDTSKYCSDNCKVKWHRGNSDKNKEKPITKFQLQTLYNSVKFLVDELGTKVSVNGVPSIKGIDLPKDFQDIKNIGILKSDNTIESLSFEKMKAAVSEYDLDEPVELIIQQYIEDRYETDQDSYPKWLKRLNNDPRINERHRAIAKTGTL